MRDGLIGDSNCALLLLSPASMTPTVLVVLVGDFTFAIGMWDDASGDGANGDSCNESNGTVSGEFKIDLKFGLDGDSSEDFLFSSSLVP